MSAVFPYPSLSLKATPTLCFHCGLPNGDEGIHARIGSVEHSFCCPGCEAAATMIAGLGLIDYYRLREQAGGRPKAQATDLDPYDDPVFQASFVRDLGEAGREASLLLEDVRCSACLWLIEEALKPMIGVHAIQINYVTRRAALCWDPEAIRLSAILQRIATLGYGAYPYRPEHVDTLRGAEQRQWLWRLFVAGFGMMQVMMYALPAYIASEGDMAPEYEALMRWASFVLTLPVVLYSAQPFFTAAWRGLRGRKLGMDFPVALGVAIAFAASSWATFAHRGQVYFDSLCMFIFLLLLGRYLEVLARNAAGRSLSHLARLTPALAERLKNFPASREGERVPAAQLAAGDVLLVKPGETIAADGFVCEGRSAVNEALLSGESRPVLKIPGASVTGGSINVESPLLIRVQRVGQASTLAAITRLVERAAAQKQPLAESSDRYAQKFVWLILAVTLVTVGVWLFIDPARAPWIAVSLLVATCPCALSLAAPVALTTTTGRLAREGVIVTRGHTIESLARATDFVFDKTGTLTEGRMSVAAFETKGKLSADKCLALAQALESASEHPIGKAIRAYAQTARAAVLDLVDADTLRAFPAAGVEARFEGKAYRLGNFEFCAALSPHATSIRLLSNDQVASQYTTIWLACEGEMLACFELSDRIKDGAAELVTALQSSGKKVHLLSGDSAGPVRSIAQQLGITHFRACASPTEKREYVEALQQSGAKVAMIGDGVNDAPVLAVADVSIAMGDGAVLAQTQADAVLLNAKPRDLLRALRLSERTLRIIRQNLWWAFAYNPLIIPLAAVGMLDPWVAGLGMSLSSLLVTINALRLRNGNR